MMKSQITQAEKEKGSEEAEMEYRPLIFKTCKIGIAVIVDEGGNGVRKRFLFLL
jgi:hypothetical protein